MLEGKINIWVMAVVLLSLLPSATLAREGGKHSARASVEAAGPWDYEGDRGPANWAALSDDYSLCGTGSRQSPIDIAETSYEKLPPLNFRYHTSMLSVHRDPNRLWLEYDSGSYLKIRDERFQLIGFDFHTPGEHSFHGVPAEMEIHLHHVDSVGNRLIVAIPVVGGHRKNITLSRIWENTPQGLGRRHYRRVGINAMFLLPVDRSYFVYQGSETRPPCQENVRWIVFNKPVRVSSSEIGRYQAILGNNARPVQPRNGRVILRDRR